MCSDAFSKYKKSEIIEVTKRKLIEFIQKIKYCLYYIESETITIFLTFHIFSHNFLPNDLLPYVHATFSSCFYFIKYSTSNLKAAANQQISSMFIHINIKGWLFY